MVCDCQGYQGKPGDDEHPAILVVLHRLISSQDREQKCCDGKGQRFVTKYGVEEKEMGIGHIDHRRNPCHATRHRHLLVKEVQRQDHQQAGGGYDDASRRKCVQAAHRAERVRHNFKSGIKRTHREQRIDAEEVLRLQYSIRGNPVQHRVIRRDVEGAGHQLDEEETHPHQAEQADTLKAQRSGR